MASPATLRSTVKGADSSASELVSAARTCASWVAGSSASSRETCSARSAPACRDATARAPSSTAVSTSPTTATPIPHSSIAVPRNPARRGPWTRARLMTSKRSLAIWVGMEAPP